MKISSVLDRYKMIIALLVFNLIQTVLWAQDNSSGGQSSDGSSSSSLTTSHSSTTTTAGNANWYASPWVWVVGAAILILLIVALSSGRRSSGTSDRVTVSKTVTRDTDPDTV